MKTSKKIVSTVAVMALSTLAAASIVSADTEKNGWVEENVGRGSGWFYYEDDVKLTDSWLQDANGLWYYLDDEGEMVTKDWVDEDYYVDANGVMVTGWFNKANNSKNPTGEDRTDYYFFGNDGEVYRSAWIQGAAGEWYYVDEDGVMLDDCLGIEASDGEVDDYAFRKGGAMLTGWYEMDDDEWYYADADGELVIDDWAKISNEWFYFEDSLMIYDGLYTIDGSTFYFDEDGIMQTGWVDVDDSKDNTVWNYFNSDGELQTSKWVKDDGEWYLLKADGTIYDDTDGFVAVVSDSDKVVSATSGAIIAPGLEVYAFDDDGEMLDGAQKINDEYYFFEDGVAITEDVANVTINNIRKLYYFGTDGKIVKDAAGDYVVDGKTYTVDANGVAKKK